MAGKSVVGIELYESRANAERFLKILEKCAIATMPQDRNITPNKTMIALGPIGKHFCWLHYRDGRKNIDCIVEPAIPASRINDVKELLNRAGVKWKALHRPRSSSRTVDIHLSAADAEHESTWKYIQEVLAISVSAA